MLILDANVLVYAVNQDAEPHRQVKKWLEEQLAGSEPVALPWNVLLAFLRLTTRPGLFRKPLSVDESLEIVSAWLAQDCVMLIHPGPRHFEILRELLRKAGTGGNLTSDAHLAALAIEHDATLCSLDADFARFPRLAWKSPLAA
jgi:toxin-antitoxin system PIN domain toxin